VPDRNPAAADERGVVAVEFALVLPLLVTLVFGIVQFGLALNTKLTLTHAAREGARAAVVGSDVKTAVKDAATGIGLKTSDIDVVECDEDEVGEQAEVEASTEYELSIPFTELGDITLSSKAVMRCP
jgi:Flp pilus assembly protein TadG